jgi:oligopeptidase A
MFQDFNINDLENSPKEVEKLAKESLEKIEDLKKIEDKTYNSFIKPYMHIAEKFSEFTTPLFHIDSVKSSEITTKVYSDIIPIVSEYSTTISQDEEIFKIMKDIYDNQKNTLNNTQLKVLENELRDFKLGGCGLDDKNKNRLKEINLELSQLSHNFSKNLLDATNDYELIIENEEDVKEIPKSDLALAKQEKDFKTVYKFTLQMPSYIAYMTYGTNRKLREELYKAYNTRAPQNSELIDKILVLKDEEAKILGFKNYAQLSLATKSAKDENDVVSFLMDIATKSKQAGNKELEELKAFAKEYGFDDQLQSYDLTYYSEKLKKAKYDIDEEEYRPYFEKKSVLKGFFDFLNEVFGIEFSSVDVPTWDDKVDVYNISRNGKVTARVYIDLEARTDKRGGAWMNNWHTRYIDGDGKLQLPTAYLVGNFPQSKDDIPSLLRHGDVVTLFHEMGHTLHHLLSDIDEAFVSGINGVTWDTVEFPSQFLEYFAYDKDVLKLFAKHHETKEVISDEMIDKIIKAKNFQSAIATLRQVEFALFDFTLHQKLYQGNEVQNRLDEVRKEVAVILPPKYNKFQNGFSHIFAGGYSAGYYSYKWAEVLSADAFMLFIENGVMNKTLAKKYSDTIFAKGGSIDMMELFKEFANKEPQVDSLLKIDGIL